jgi:thiol-disulfide isomerase/thioredoxin
MKQILFFLLAIPLLLSCGKESKKVFSLEGSVINATQKYFVVSKPDLTKDTISIDTNGKFTYQSTIAEPAYYYLICNKGSYLPVFFSGGMKLKLTLDGKDPGASAKFEGEGADKNNYLSARAVNDKNIKANDYELIKQDSTSFFAAVGKIRAAQTKLFDEFKKENPDDDFWKVQKAEIDYGWANKISDYPSGYQYYVDTAFKIPDNYYNRTNMLNINDKDLIPSREFGTYLSNLIDRKTRAKMKSIPDSSSRAAFPLLCLETAKSAISDDAVRDYFMARSLTGLLSYMEMSTLEKAIKFFRENCKVEKERAGFEKEFESWLKLEKGQMAYDFSGETVSRQKVKLTDLKGKYVYVDIWATWCGPCKYEIPFLLKLEEAYHNRNIVFLSYSIDDDRTAWEKFIPEKKLKGMQLIGEKGWESKICKDYKVRGVPTFMLFDPRGKIISVKMTRPSDAKTRATFDSMPDL